MTVTRRSPRPAAETPRVWQRMLSGRRLDLLEPSPFDIEIEDIAHGLARVARWNGQTRGAHAFSVAEHSLLVEDFCARLKPDLEPRWQMAALIHDAAEYVIGDMISPFKTVLGDSYKDIERGLERAINLRFSLPAILPAPVKKLIKQADHHCAWFEAVQLAGFSIEEADRFFGRPPAHLSVTLDPLPPTEAQARFLARHGALLTAVDAA